MPNSLSTMPIVLDTDIASFKAAQTLNPGQPCPTRIYRMALAANGITAAGVITVNDPISGREILTPMAVTAGSTDKTILFVDEFTPILVTDFAVAGLAATGTKLHIWYRG